MSTEDKPRNAPAQSIVSAPIIDFPPPSPSKNPQTFTAYGTVSPDDAPVTAWIMDGTTRYDGQPSPVVAENGNWEATFESLPEVNGLILHARNEADGSKGNRSIDVKGQPSAPDEEPTKPEIDRPVVEVEVGYDGRTLATRRVTVLGRSLPGRASVRAIIIDDARAKHLPEFAVATGSNLRFIFRGVPAGRRCRVKVVNLAGNRKQKNHRDFDT